MYIIFIMILSIILAALSVITIVKNFLVSFNVSDNGWKTALIVILIVICLFCALISYSEAYTIRDINVMQPSSGLTQDDIDQLKSLIPGKTIIISVSIGIGYIAYLLQTLLIKKIREKKLKEMESNTSRRWTRFN